VGKRESRALCAICKLGGKIWFGIFPPSGFSTAVSPAALCFLLVMRSLAFLPRFRTEPLFSAISPDDDDIQQECVQTNKSKQFVVATYRAPSNIRGLRICTVPYALPPRPQLLANSQPIARVFIPHEEIAGTIFSSRTWGTARLPPDHPEASLEYLAKRRAVTDGTVLRSPSGSSRRKGGTSSRSMTNSANLNRRRFGGNAGSDRAAVGADRIESWWSIQQRTSFTAGCDKARVEK
jgi:hypothetical protein